MKSQSYSETAYNLDNKNTHSLQSMIYIRRFLGLDEYNPTYSISQTDVVVRYPSFKDLKDDHIVIKKVIIQNNQTIVELSNKNKIGNSYFLWMTINKGTYICVNGQKYYLKGTEGIGINPKKTYFYSEGQAKDFALYLRKTLD